MTLRAFLAGKLVERDVQALGFEDTADCEVVVGVRGNRIDPDGPYALVTLGALEEALSGETAMFLTNIRNYHHHFQRAHAMVAAAAPVEMRETFFDAFIDAANARLARRNA